MSITVTVTDPALLAGVNAKASQQGKDSQTFLQDFVIGSCHAFRDEFALDRITSAAFVFRFTEAEYAAVKASSDPVVQGFIARLDTEPFVWLGSDEVQQAMAYVVTLGLVTQARADAILAY